MFLTGREHSLRCSLSIMTYISNKCFINTEQNLQINPSYRLIRAVNIRQSCTSFQVKQKIFCRKIRASSRNDVTSVHEGLRVLGKCIGGIFSLAGADKIVSILQRHIIRSQKCWSVSNSSTPAHTFRFSRYTIRFPTPMRCYISCQSAELLTGQSHFVSTEKTSL